MLVPYFDGERTPFRPDATGLLRGIRSTISREQLARAAVEGVVCSLLDGIDAMQRAGVPVSDGTLFLVGGAARSPAYRQILADLAQRPVTVPEGAEFVARGACVQAASVVRGVSAADIIREWSPGTISIVYPDAEADADTVRAAYCESRDFVV